MRQWALQITRNELTNFYRFPQVFTNKNTSQTESETEKQENCICVDEFVKTLPEKYKSVMWLIYFEGKKQKETANELKISLGNVKIRLSRGKKCFNNNS